MKTAVCATILFFCACGDDSMANPDGPSVDAPASIDAPRIDAPPDAIASDGHCVGDGGMGTRHHIYLLFDGVMLTPGNDDSRTNHTSLINNPSTVPPFLGTASNRQQVIGDISANVRQMLNGYNVDVTTTRPASGDYTMIVFATAQSVGLSPGIGAIGYSDCGNANADDVGLVVDMGTGTGINAIYYSNLVMFDVGLSLGVGTNQLAGDCMNDIGNTGPGLCSLSSDVAIHQGCGPDGGTQNEQEIFADQLGCL
jgi:hypothetical protein